MKQFDCVGNGCCRMSGYWSSNHTISRLRTDTETENRHWQSCPYSRLRTAAKAVTNHFLWRWTVTKTVTIPVPRLKIYLLRLIPLQEFNAKTPTLLLYNKLLFVVQLKSKLPVASCFLLNVNCFACDAIHIL